MRGILTCLIFFPVLGFTQQGIHFTEVKSWRNMISKAKVYNKYIFLYVGDSTAEDCKRMDQEVYPDKKVGGFFNSNFVCFRLMTTRSKKSKGIPRRYKVVNFPSYLFLSPQGTVLHKGIMFKNADDLIQLAKDALDPEKEYYPLLHQYLTEERDYNEMSYLARTAWSIKDGLTGNKIGRDLVNNYILQLPEAELYTKDHINFMKTLLINSHKATKEKAFYLFYHDSSQIDAIAGSHFSNNVVEFVIAREEVDSKLWRRSGQDIQEIVQKPDWCRIAATISKKYSQAYAERVVLGAQLRWYEYKKDTNQLIVYNVKKIETEGIDMAPYARFGLNNIIYDLFFKHCNDTAVIDKAIYWMEILLKSDPENASFLDTYANLLYKRGRDIEGLKTEERAIHNDPHSEDIENNYARMRRGEPTWNSN